MHHKITSLFIALPLLCLLILAGLWLTYPELVEGEQPLTNEITFSTLNSSKDNLEFPPLAAPDFSGGENVELVAQIGDESLAVAVEGDYAYVGMGPSLLILDISDPVNPTKVGQVILPDIVQGVAIANNYAYVADGSSGLQVINIANPAAPIEVSAIATPSGATSFTKWELYLIAIPLQVG